jgi:hypothetical protein
MDCLYGELDRQAKARLMEHLRGCEPCRAQVETWRFAMHALDAWRLPQAQAPRPVLPRVARWAAAALVLVALGIGIGRLTAPVAPDVEALRTALEASLKASLAPAIRDEVRQELNAACKASAGALRAEMEDLAVATLAASTTATERLIGEYARALDATRRNDLLTLASLTEQELLRTRRQMATALARAPTAAPVVKMSIGSEDSKPQGGNDETP